jgi:hypothetical protein
MSSGAQRIDEIVKLLEAYALGQIDLRRERVMAALKLLDLMVPDATPWPDDGDEAPVLADEPTAPVFRPKYLT